MVGSLEMLSGRSKKEYAREAEAVEADDFGGSLTNGAANDQLEAVVAM